jgi:RHS repeat-associated protein
VTALINALDGTLLANYEYGPFGEPIRLTGALAKNNPFRFSTKYQDDESDLLYYGYRYFKPSTGGWPSRDPMQEQGGMNLYLFSVNNPIRHIYDTPGVLSGLDIGDALDINMVFVGRIVDVSKKNKIIAQKSYTLKISGAYPDLTISP